MMPPGRGTEMIVRDRSQLWGQHTASVWVISCRAAAPKVGRPLGVTLLGNQKRLRAKSIGRLEQAASPPTRAKLCRGDHRCRRHL